MDRFKGVIKFSTAVILIIFGISSNAQESLTLQYEDLIKNHETYNRYKVIPLVVLDEFWRQVADSVETRQKQIVKLEAEIRDQQRQLDSLTNELNTTIDLLQESEFQNNSISFMGLTFTKISYHVIVWSLIIILLVLGVMAYSMFIRSNQITVKARKDLEASRAELENHKDNAREKQVKLKRELQTAINTIDELRRGRR